MKRKIANTRQPNDLYFDLIQRHPLKPIRTESDYDIAATLAMELSERAEDDRLTKPEHDYLEVLLGLLESWDSRAGNLPAQAEPSGILQHLIESRQMSPAQLGKVVGNASLASAMLNGRRSISKANAKLLAKYFRVSPAVFI